MIRSLKGAVGLVGLHRGDYLVIKVLEVDRVEKKACRRIVARKKKMVRGVRDEGAVRIIIDYRTYHICAGGGAKSF